MNGRREKIKGARTIYLELLRDVGYRRTGDFVATVGDVVMPAVTYFVAIPFSRDDDGNLPAGEPKECQSADVDTPRRAWASQSPIDPTSQPSHTEICVSARPRGNNTVGGWVLVRTQQRMRS